ESGVLALVSTAFALVVAHVVTTALVALISTDADPVALDLSLNLRVLAFTAFLATLTVMIAGLVPAVRTTRVDPQLALKAQGRGLVEGHARFTLGKALVAGQVALSLVL